MKKWMIQLIVLCNRNGFRTGVIMNKRIGFVMVAAMLMAANVRAAEAYVVVPGAAVVGQSSRSAQAKASRVSRPAQPDLQTCSNNEPPSMT